MHSNFKKLFYILSTFSPEDWKQFSHYLQSPYFVRGRDYSFQFKILLRLFSRKQRPGEASFGEFIDKAIESSGNKRSSYESRLYEITSHATEYIKLKNMMSNRFYGEYEFLKYCMKHGIYNFFRSEYNLRSVDINTGGMTIRNMQYLSGLFSYIIETDIINNDLDSALINFNSRSYLESAVIIESLCYYAIEEYKLANIGIKTEFSPILEIMRSIDIEKIMRKVTEKGSPVFSRAVMYYYLYEIFVNGRGKEYLDKLEERYFNPSGVLPDELLSYFSTVFKDYYWDKINRGETRHIKPLFRMYLNDLTDGKIPESRKAHREKIFDNYVGIGILAGKHDFVRKFVKDNLETIPEKNREEVNILSMLRLHFSVNDFRSALEVIESRKRKKIRNGVILRFKLRSMYELGMSEEIFLEIDKINHYLKSRNGLQSGERIRTRIFIKYLTKLQKFSPNTDKEELQLFENSLFKAGAEIPASDWFISKVRILLKNK